MRSIAQCLSPEPGQRISTPRPNTSVVGKESAGPRRARRARGWVRADGMHGGRDGTGHGIALVETLGMGSTQLPPLLASPAAKPRRLPPTSVAAEQRVLRVADVAASHQHRPGVGGRHRQRAHAAELWRGAGAGAKVQLQQLLLAFIQQSGPAIQLGLQQEQGKGQGHEAESSQEGRDQRTRPGGSGGARRSRPR